MLALFQHIPLAYHLFLNMKLIIRHPIANAIPMVASRSNVTTIPMLNVLMISSGVPSGGVPSENGELRHFIIANKYYNM